MKKTLLTAVLCLGAGVVSAAEFSYGTASDENSGGYTAFDFTLNDTNWLTTTESTLAESYTLNKITLGMYGTWYTNASNNKTTSWNTGIAIFVKDAEASWSYVGKSDMKEVKVLQREKADYDFNFTGVELSSSTTYTAVFYGDSTAFNALTEGSTLSSLAGGASANDAHKATTESPLVAAGVQLRELTKKRQEDGTTVTDTVYQASEGMYSWDGTESTAYFPEAVFSVTAVKSGDAIPEPATATLSLLALAGLAARRRRK